jgi:hypothetical protein
MYIKGFNKDLKCRGFQFEIGKEYKIEKTKELKLCTDTVFHFCDNIQKTENFYSYDGVNRFCEIEVLGDLISDNEKMGSNHIKILREFKKEELDFLVGKINGNSGKFNSGNYNSGNYNSGYLNSGDYNSGNYNSGYLNSGNYNSGYRNTGTCNTGDYNTGTCNTGTCNTGDYNSGYYNTGDFNTCDYSAGIFCTQEPKLIIFDIETDMTMSEFKNSIYQKALFSSPFELTKWIKYTEDEKKNDKEKQQIGGYLKKYTYEEACRNWWDNMTEENKKIIKSMPNFDNGKFEQITGIKV